MQALKLSYDALSSYLKPYFAFCSLLPKAYSFNNVDIASLWMTQGYLTFSSKINQNSEEIGVNYVREFCSRSLLQVEIDLKTVVSFKIHDLVHDLAISVANFGYSTVNSRPTDAFEKVCHVSISIKDLPEDEKSVPEFILHSQKLRTILFPDIAKGAINILGFLRTSISRFKYMRVIDLRESTVEEILSSIGKLSHLRFFSVSKNKKIRRLPNSICKLLELEYLDLGQCEALEELPKDIGNMINFRYLSISTQQVYLPKGTFRGLCLLQSLGFSKCIHLNLWGEEFQYLLNLGELCIHNCKNLESLPPNLKNLQAFDTLVINDCKTLELMNSESGQGIRGLGSFNFIQSDVEALPDWLHESANTLQSIFIASCYNLTTLPEWLEGLKMLEGQTIGSCPKLSALPQGLHYLTTKRTEDLELS